MPYPPRRLGLLDMMILFAAIAPGLAWTRFLRANSITNEGHLWVPYFVISLQASPGPENQPIRLALVTTADWHSTAGPAAATGAVGLGIVRLRRPRPRGRRVFLQPGGAACAAVGLGLAMAGVRLGLDWIVWRTDQWAAEVDGTTVAYDWSDGLYATFRPTEIGALVLASWTPLALSGHLRAERSTIDRLGRLVGLFWIAGLPLIWAAGEWG